MAQPLLGDYNCEEVVLTLEGIKFGDVINPTQFGQEERISAGARARAEVTEGQGGGAVISHQHSRISEYTLTLLETDEANKQLDDGAEKRERYKFKVIDNSSTDCVLEGVVWLRELAPWNKGRVAGERQWVFQAWETSRRHGQSAIIGGA